MGKIYDAISVHCKHRSILFGKSIEIKRLYFHLNTYFKMIATMASRLVWKQLMQ